MCVCACVCVCVCVHARTPVCVSCIQAREKTVAVAPSPDCPSATIVYTTDFTIPVSGGSNTKVGMLAKDNLWSSCEKSF